MSDDALIERLVLLRGVGRWTVEMFLIYSLERADVLPADDFGVSRRVSPAQELADGPRAAADLWRASSQGREFERKNRSALR